MAYNADTPAKSQFRAENCDYCDKRTLQQLQRIDTPLGDLDFYQCYKCGTPLSTLSGESLPEWQIARIQEYRPFIYKNRPLKDLGRV